MKNKKNETILSIVLIVVSVVLITIMVITMYPQPYTEITTLQKQYIGNTTGNGGICTNCLIMEVGAVYIDLSDVAYPIKEHGVYYFAREHEIRKDIHPGDSIDIKWKYVLFKGYRIREVSFRHRYFKLGDPVMHVKDDMYHNKTVVGINGDVLTIQTESGDTYTQHKSWMKHYIADLV